MTTDNNAEIVAIIDEALPLEVVKNENWPEKLFSTPGGLQPVLDKIKDITQDAPVDAATKENRDKLRSLANKIARSKTFIDNMGKGVTEEWARKKKLVDSERKRVRTALDDLKNGVRAPLTEYEEEKKRVKEHVDSYFARINSILAGSLDELVELSGHQGEPVDCLSELKLAVADEHPASAMFDKRYTEALDMQQKAVERIDKEIERTKIAAEQAAEIARLEAEKKEAERRHQEEIRIKEAEARAIAETEARMQRELEAQREEFSRQVAAFPRLPDNPSATQAVDANQSNEYPDVSPEPESCEATYQTPEAPTKEHKAAVNRAALAAIVENCGLSDSQGKDVIRAIVLGKIPGVSINYN